MRRSRSGLRILVVATGLLVLGLSLQGAPASAADFPNKPIQFIVPYGAGGSTDVMARAIATVAPKYFPQPLVVVNKPGGGGIPGRVDVVKSRPDGYTLLVGWGSTYGPIYEATKTARAAGESVSALHMRHLNPLPNGLEKIFAKFRRIIVIEMNDEGLYGHGQLASILRARYCDPKITSMNKTNGLTFSVKEILEGVLK